MMISLVIVTGLLCFVAPLSHALAINVDVPKPVCGSWQWKCRDGSCIDFDGKCDGIINCYDQSDETHALCGGKKCPGHLFRCAYGACVDGDVACNGLRGECADDSDEIGPQCSNSSRVEGFRFRCDNGGWIDSTDKCDGTANCVDGSDENVEACGNLTCAPFLFQCAYGACVDNSRKCNGVKDCEDNSDEDQELCPQTNIRGGKKCSLPGYPKNGKYTVYNQPNARPFTLVDSATIIIECDRNYGVANFKTEYSCVSGRWGADYPVPTECVRQCRLNLNKLSIEYELCFYPNASASACTALVPSGTVVKKAKCRLPDFYSDVHLSEMTCNDGEWDYQASTHCKPECGQITPQGTALVTHGRAARHAELPWHVAIYDKTKDESDNNICGGTIVKSNIVLSAAHCFWDLKSKSILPAGNYEVGGGKIYRSLHAVNDTEEQDIQVKEIVTPENFRGDDNSYAVDIAILILADQFEYRPYIQPACLLFDRAIENRQLIAGAMGKVAGWGLVSAGGNTTDELQTVNLPFIPINECNKRVPSDFKKFLVSDKFCAGFDNGTTVCLGDSGGGLVYKTTNFFIDRYYLRGIVSTTPRDLSTSNPCNANAIVTFTRVSDFEDWIRKYVLDNVP